MASPPFNPSSLYGRDVRRVYSGKDATIYDGDGNLLSTVDSFSATMTFNTADYQSLGSPIQQAFLTGYSINIEISNCVVESEQFLQGAADFSQFGRHAPAWTLRSVINGYGSDGNEETWIFRDCVPSGDWNIANYSIGDIIKRTLRLRANVAPELQKSLSAEA